MQGFYNDLVTAKSWVTLQELKRKIDFILIGGWAVYLYTKALKSKDIDIIAGYDQLDKLRQDFEVAKNDRLKKYEARHGEVQIDVYLPHYSNIGMPVEEIKDLQKRGAFLLPSAEMLVVLKQLVYRQRGLTSKGQKDRLDVLSLLCFSEIDFKKYAKLAKNFGLVSDLQKLIAETVKIPEIGVNEHQWGKEKKGLLSAFKVLTKK